MLSRKEVIELNHILFVGRTTKDLEMKAVGEGKQMTSFTLAINRTYKNANGEIEADFVHCSTPRSTISLS